MTAQKLLTADPQFAGFIEFWVQERFVPLPLADYLLEISEPKLSAAVVWAASVPQRGLFNYPLHGETSFLYPGKFGNWYLVPTIGTAFSDSLPEGVFNETHYLYRKIYSESKGTVSLPLAIALMLDGWVAARGHTVEDL